MTFKEELAELINKHSKENKSNTPDFILAQYLNNCLMCFEIAVDKREVWHGRPSPRNDSFGGFKCSNLPNPDPNPITKEFVDKFNGITQDELDEWIKVDPNIGQALNRLKEALAIKSKVNNGFLLFMKELEEN